MTATITIRPPGIIDRPHRHTSAAINYYFHGTGYSVVEKKRFDWKAGDLMLRRCVKHIIRQIDIKIRLVV